MPEGTTPPADGQQGTGATPPVGTGAAPETKPGRTFTQDELDAIIEARLKRAVPADYEELKATAAKVKEQEDKEKTDLQKANEARALAEQKANDRLKLADSKLRRAAIIEEASSQKAADADTIVALLASSEDITVEEDGSVKGAKKAVKDLLAAKPFLIAGAGAPATSGGQFGGNDQSTLDEQITALEAKGDYKGARQLKLRRYASTQG